VNPYDALPYGQRPFPDAHPDRLYVAGRAFGRDPVPLEQARILELGCGEGGHLVPLSLRYPGARCVGIDLSGHAITEARAFAERLGATATFLELDVLHAVEALRRPDLPEAYDYVLAHGLYSWVPPEVREAILAVCAAVLSPGGLFYLSYNTRPGWHLRGMIAEILQHHTKGFDDPRKKVAQARAILAFLAEQVPAGDPYGAILQKEAKLVARQPDPWVFHDLLAPYNFRFLLSEFVADLGRHGLQYVADADVASMLPERLPTQAREVLLPFFEDPVAGEQYMDFLVGRYFRRSVGGRPQEARPFDWTVFRTMALRGTLKLVPEESGPTQDTFRTQLGDTLSSDVPLVRAALRTLTVTPGAVPWVTFEDRVLAAVSAPESQRELLGRNLVVAWIRGGLEVHPAPLGLQGRPGPRPVVDPLVRAMAPLGEGVTSVFHDFVRTDGLDRELLPLLDGTRTVQEALDLVVLADDPMRERVLKALPERFARYAELGLLVS
jgi:SAM-dependent methyltransferase